MTLGKKIKQLRVLNNISQTDLAKKINTHQSHLGRYERDETTPSAFVVKKIADHFEVSTDFLLYDSENMNDSLDKELEILFSEANKLSEPNKLFIIKLLKMVLNDSQMEKQVILKNENY
jgi:transcriptional regulator with XRE-family HTH domain